ncbi:glycoside hydrolase superfamily [Fusarium flagelliforme]|uniref:glycoside hydrolase superfamily n=1 Tax=Fusarium flagelliforme TaxID=2675880 RepID=UPI001E8E0A8B|nr:glycoside hydrolase superfamily [Fusarium flagelliforme]KAH7197190.1 glycoside hydrolase superfamily [Fusarium flagelliforme]
MPSDNYNFGDVFQKIYVSKQKPPPLPVPENMKVVLQSFPPLGQVTSVVGKSVTLTTVLEIPKSRANESWEVSAWHSVDNSDWKDVQLFSIQDTPAPQTLQTLDDSMSCFYFSTSISFEASIRFTLKFRHSPDAEWRWIRDEQGLNDGLAVNTPVGCLSDNLSDLIPDINTKDWTIRSHLSQSPRTSLWSLEADIPPVNSDDSIYRDITIGSPWGTCARWFSLVRLWSPWLAPRHGKSHFSLDKDGALCCFLSPKGKNLVFLAVGGISHVLPVFRSEPDGKVQVHARNDGLSEEKAVILVSEGDDFECAMASVMYHARNLVSVTKQVNDKSKHELTALMNDFKPEWLEYWFDGLGFCTWNALGQKLTDQKIFDALDKLSEHEIKVSSLIIDDNWQSIDYQGPSQFQYGWTDFEAEPKAFPQGLKATVSHIRKNHPHIQHIAVWHALLGYWGGISPDGNLAKTYKTIEVTREDADRRNLPLGGRMTVIAQEDVNRFYDDFYRFLSDAGVDAVKTDAQFMIDTWIEASPRRDLINTYLDAWNISTLRHFSAKAISCMSQFPQALFHSQMPTNRPAILVRNSDDFFPEIPASHPWHVWTNAHNAIFMSYLNVLPDWDMFQTVHEYSGFHAAARCISGGPIYITDVPGEHNMDLIRQMTGLTPQGKTVIFRPSSLGKTVDPYVGYDDDLLLKVGSHHRASHTGYPLLGIFNVSSRPLTELVSLSSFPGIVPGYYVVRAHTTGKVSQPTTLEGSGSLFTTSLPIRGYEILSAFSLTPLSSSKHGEVYVSNLGLLGKMAGVAAVIMNDIKQELQNSRVTLVTRIKAFGKLGIYISALPSLTIDGDFLITIQEKVIPVHTVAISAVDKYVLEIDIGKAWKEMGLESRWSNDVEVKVHFSL